MTRVDTVDLNHEHNVYNEPRIVSRAHLSVLFELHKVIGLVAGAHGHVRRRRREGEEDERAHLAGSGITC